MNQPKTKASTQKPRKRQKIPTNTEAVKAVLLMCFWALISLFLLLGC